VLNCAPKCQLIEQSCNNGIPSGRFVGGSVDFDRDAVVEVNALARFPLDKTREHRHRREQPAHVAHDHARLLAIGGNDHHRRAFSWPKAMTPIFETGEVPGNRRERERFSSPAPNTEESFVAATLWWVLALRALLEQLTLLLRERQPE